MNAVYALLVDLGSVVVSAPIIILIIKSGAPPGVPARFATIGGLIASGVIGYMVADSNWYGPVLAIVSFTFTSLALVGMVAARFQS
jgi:hypothetical protein